MRSLRWPVLGYRVRFSRERFDTVASEAWAALTRVFSATSGVLWRFLPLRCTRTSSLLLPLLSSSTLASESDESSVPELSRSLSAHETNGSVQLPTIMSISETCWFVKRIISRPPSRDTTGSIVNMRARRGTCPVPRVCLPRLLGLYSGWHTMCCSSVS